jgi:hypothetical protein
MSDKPRALFEVRPRLDGRGFLLISESLPFGDLWYEDQEVAIGHAGDSDEQVFLISGRRLTLRRALAAGRRSARLNQCSDVILIENEFVRNTIITSEQQALSA